MVHWMHLIVIPPDTFEKVRAGLTVHWNAFLMRHIQLSASAFVARNSLAVSAVDFLCSMVRYFSEAGRLTASAIAFQRWRVPERGHGTSTPPDCEFVRRRGCDVPALRCVRFPSGQHQPCGKSKVNADNARQMLERVVLCVDARSCLLRNVGLIFVSPESCACFFRKTFQHDPQHLFSDKKAPKLLQIYPFHCCMKHLNGKTQWSLLEIKQPRNIFARCRFHLSAVLFYCKTKFSKTIFSRVTYI